MDFLSNDGELIPLDVVGIGELTSWLITSVTIPLGVTRARTFKLTPVFCWATELANSELPPCWTLVTAWAVRVGTEGRTFRTAGMLSVAMTEGAERTLARFSFSCSCTAARSSRLFPTKVAVDRLVTPAPKSLRNVWGVLPDTRCNWALTSL